MLLPPSGELDLALGFSHWYPEPSALPRDLRKLVLCSFFVSFSSPLSLGGSDFGLTGGLGTFSVGSEKPEALIAVFIYVHVFRVYFLCCVLKRMP